MSAHLINVRAESLGKRATTSPPGDETLDNHGMCGYMLCYYAPRGGLLILQRCFIGAKTEPFVVSTWRRSREFHASLWLPC